MTESELIESCLIEFAGWKWWAFPWMVRDEVRGGYTKTPIRSFRSSEFPNDNWRAWAKREECGIVPATGDEPLMPACFQSKTMPNASAVAVMVEREIADRGLQFEYARALRETTGSTNLGSMSMNFWRVATASPEDRMRAALIAVGKES